MANKNLEDEISARAKTTNNVLKFGIEYIDDALRGIYPDDLVLVGAPSGMGKTQLCCNIAKANLKDGRKVHYIALEASEFEIERRLKFQIVMSHYYGDPNRPNLGKISYPDWLLGKYLFELSDYEVSGAKEFEQKYQNLYLYYKQDKFGIQELIESVIYASKETDLIIIDHVHYFDLEDDNENRGMKEIAKTVRSLCIEEKKPIVLVAHLRKRDKNNEELVAGLDEFHGSSDLTKIATKVITFSGGPPDKDGRYETYFRIPKSRIDGVVSRFSGKELFDPKTGGYVSGVYDIGWAAQQRKSGFQCIEDKFYPDWGRDSLHNQARNRSSSGHSVAQRSESFSLPYKD